MDPFDILILSNVRPRRTWKIASRLTREVPGTRIYGIVQQNPGQLPLVERLIAARKTHQAVSLSPRSNLRSWFHCAFEHWVDWVLWFAHGCPRNSFRRQEFTAERLTEECVRAGWPVLLSESIRAVDISKFLGQNQPHLIIAVGEVSIEPQLTRLASRGLIRIGQVVFGTDTENSEKGFRLEIQYLPSASQAAFLLAWFNVARQPYDDLLGLTLKSDLLANDLLVRAAAGLQKADAEQASKEIREWVEQILLPSLAQLEKSKGKKMLRSVREHPRYHPLWKMCVGTLLLCSPAIAFRNLYRRWRGQYPLLIITHHLVSDRPHKLGVSTQDFWRHVCFLERYYRMVSLSEGIEMLHSGRIKDPTLALTFDDGYADNFVSLRAVAEETEMPVTLFVTTQPVETQTEFQHDATDGVRGFLPLTWDQIRYWSARGAEFGSHTRTHLDCSSRDTIVLRDELVGSKNDLESRLGRPVEFFAFPFGKAWNMSSEAMRLAASVYPYFLSALGGINLPTSSPRRQHLFRKSHCADLWELELELQSAFEFGKSLRHPTRIRERSGRCLFGFPIGAPFAESREHAPTGTQRNR